MSLAWINGSFVDESAASVSIHDTGLLHAAGVFTTMRAFNRRVFRLAQHLERLRNSCEALYIPLTFTDAQLVTAVNDLLAKNDLSDARLRLTATRGQSSHDPLHGLRLEPNIFCTAAPLEPYPAEFYERGMTVILLDEQKLNPYDLQAGHKTLNYFSRLAALREANRRGAGEALWFNVHNYLQSGSISNVFIVKDGTLITPPTAFDLRDSKIRDLTPYLKSSVLPGIYRGAVIDAAISENIAVHFNAIDVHQLLAADEVFLTNSIMQIMPVCRIERSAIASEKPGEMTIRLSKILGKMIAAE